jgi:hypothetical protein
MDKASMPRAFWPPKETIRASINGMQPIIEAVILAQ